MLEAFWGDFLHTSSFLRFAPRDAKTVEGTVLFFPFTDIIGLAKD
jgi:hypothetical protein